MGHWWSQCSRAVQNEHPLVWGMLRKNDAIVLAFAIDGVGIGTGGTVTMLQGNGGGGGAVAGWSV
jgi:hypothetical protein